jgi:SAM-dependent methyltransferase
MTIFHEYGQFYNLIYREKDYAAEVDYIDKLIKRHTSNAITILDLGCGTGQHDMLLAGKGYHVTGVDQSENMLCFANKQKELKGLMDNRIEFRNGDIRSIRLEKKFDLVISLFHVMSYQAYNDDLVRAFETAAFHLNIGGILIFDCWYGPGVLNDPPQVRVKDMEDENVIITKIAEPSINFHENVVDVRYHMFIRDKKTKQVKEIKELHRMRYLFTPEVDFFLKSVGFTLVSFSKFLHDDPPQKQDWDACFIARKEL